MDGSSRYNQAYNQNLKNLIMASTLRSYITVSGQFKSFNLLDLVQIDNDSPDSRKVGMNFITSIAYQLVDKRLVTNVTLCKEGANGLKGDLR